VRNSAHTLAKLLDPAPGHSVRVVSVTHPEYLERMHAHLVAQGGVALLLRGTEGEAFANPAAARASKPSPTAGLGRLPRRRGRRPALEACPTSPRWPPTPR
jgi:hypothetical protein